jgi:YHS domain-containing protein
MPRRLTPTAALAAGLFAVTLAAAAQQTDKAAAAKAKKALQDVQDFIGEWKAEGTAKAGAKTEAWKETLSWAWQFKGEDCWIAVESKDGKAFTKGALRYLPEQKTYRFTATDKQGQEQVYDGPFAKGTLTLDRKDAATGDVYRLKMNTAAEGVRFVLRVEKQEKGKGLFAPVFQLAGSKAGESFAGTGGRKPECIVTGGAAAIAVSHMGKTYYVCCTGCRDAFNEEPEKFVKAFEAKKK